MISDDDAEEAGEDGGRSRQKRPKPSGGKPVFSSLFRNNPDIPEVER